MSHLASDSHALRVWMNGQHVTATWQPSVCRDDVWRCLSEQLSTVVLSFHIHDGCLWMFVLSRNGKQILQFNPLPDYWQELSDTARRS